MTKRDFFIYRKTIPPHHTKIEVCYKGQTNNGRHEIKRTELFILTGI